MIVYSSMNTCMKNVLGLTRSTQIQMSNRFYNSGMKLKYISVSASNLNSSMSIISSQVSQRSCFYSTISNPNSGNRSFKINSIVRRFSCKRVLSISLKSQKLLVPNETKIPNFRAHSWDKCYGPAGLFIGLLICCSFSNRVEAEASDKRVDSVSEYSHGKKVCTDYSVIGIPGDGRCLFRSVAHGACLRSGKPAPNETLQRELADELRAKVADEFVKRREETEWFIEGNFDKYISQIKKPHVWGGEPELLMASHVLQMPITVYMHDEDSGGLISIAEYGQEYGKDNPVKVLYHGFGHYDALQIPGNKGLRSRL